MGIQLVNDTLGKQLHVKFKIRSGDPEEFFKAEAEIVGDFVFLMIRTRSNKADVLNRERVDSYDLDIVAKVKSAFNRAQRFRTPRARTRVRVRVTDTNDLGPFFQVWPLAQLLGVTLFSSVPRLHL